jgi:alkylation response protein AidB-like acyl-CoA dehydrogenase
MNERIAIAGSDQGRGSSPIELVLGHWRRSRDGMDEARRAVLRQQVAGLLIRAEVLRLTLQRANARATASVPGPEGSVGKLAVAHLHQAYYECALTVQGAAGMLHETGYPMRRPEQVASDRSTSWWFLRSRAATIEGGTSKIMRNILGERVLGLPGDIRVVPWSQVPR